MLQQQNQGYIQALKNGFQTASCAIIITMDGDGEHNPEDIPRLTSPILEEKADLVLGSRHHIPRFSERILSSLAGLAVDVRDTGTGYRAMRRELALRLELEGRCICGTSVLEAASLGARIIEVPLNTEPQIESRSIAWHHFL